MIHACLFNLLLVATECRICFSIYYLVSADDNSCVLGRMLDLDDRLSFIPNVIVNHVLFCRYLKCHFNSFEKCQVLINQQRTHLIDDIVEFHSFTDMYCLSRCARYCVVMSTYCHLLSIVLKQFGQKLSRYPSLCLPWLCEI